MKKANNSKSNFKWYGRHEEVKYHRLADRLWMMTVGDFYLDNVSLTEEEMADLKRGRCRNGSILFSSSVEHMTKFAQRGYEPVLVCRSKKSAKLAFLKDTPGYVFQYLPVEDKRTVPEGMHIVLRHSWLLVTDCVRPVITFDLRTGAIHNCLIPNSILLEGDYDIVLDRELLIAAIQNGEVQKVDLDCRGRINRNGLFSVRVGTEVGFINVRQGDRLIGKQINTILNAQGMKNVQPLLRNYCALDDANKALVIADGSENVLYEIERQQPPRPELGINYPFVLKAGNGSSYDASDISIESAKPLPLTLSLNGIPQLTQTTLNSIAKLPTFQVLKPFNGCLDKYESVLFCDEDYLNAEYVPVVEADKNYRIVKLRKYRWYRDPSQTYVNRHGLTFDLMRNPYPPEVLKRFKHLPSNHNRHLYSMEELELYDRLASSGYIELTSGSNFSLYNLSLYTDLLRNPDRMSFTATVEPTRLIKASITFEELFDNLEHINYQQSQVLMIVVHGRESSFCKFALPKLAKSEMDALVILAQWQNAVKRFESRIPPWHLF